jgi:dephospho-CoA kinase
MPFSHNVATGTPAADPGGLVPADPAWADQGRRALARLATACGHRARRIDHIGSTAVTGMDARDIIDLQVTVESLTVADDLAGDLLRAGYPRVDAITADRRYDGGEGLLPKRFHASADPGRPTHVHIRVDGEPNQRFALLFVDWLNASPAARTDYLAVKRTADDGAVGRWFLDAYPRARLWADSTGWSA